MIKQFFANSFMIKSDMIVDIILDRCTMISNLKLKLKQNKDENTHSRRIKTQTNENIKKISFYGAKSRQPLVENKRIVNQSQTVPLKKSKPTKSIGTKNSTLASKLVTENRDRAVMSFGHRQAIEKIFGHSKKESSLAINLPMHGKKQKDEKQGKQGKQSKLIGAARYCFEDKVGSGTFGIVHKARDRKTLDIVAIKRVFQDKKYKNRELQILKQLNHPNILKIKDSFFTYEEEKEYLNVVMDYFPNNLYESIQKSKVKGEIERLKIKILAYQMFRGLLYLESKNIAHRDMKPQNILVDDKNWSLIICDFGSAKKLSPNESNLAYICSRCYRAPELIFGSTDYSTQIDMWSAGCILLEMMIFTPIFRSESNVDQLFEIIKILGTPTYDQIMEMNSQCDVKKYQFPMIKPRAWEKVVKKKYIGQQFFDLLDKVMVYSPKQRISPYEALKHPFFDQLRDEQTYRRLKKQKNIIELFNFSVTKEIDEGKIMSLVPSWYRE